VNKELERPEIPRYGFLEGTQALARLAPFLGEATFVQIQSDLEVYERLQKGDIDVFFDEDPAVTFFDQYPDAVADYYYPQVHSVVCIATQIPELAPVISVIQKYVEQGAYTHLADLYNLGQQDYQQYKFWIKLTDQEMAYIHLHRDPEQAIKIGLQYDNYPLSFYNAQERQWQGIVPDLLQRMNALTGLEFFIANKPMEIRSSLLDMLEQGAVSMMGQLLYTENREGRFIWVDEPYVKDRYALLSRDDFPDVAVNKLITERVGIVDESVYTEVFPDWFPRGRQFKIYPTFAEAFDALEKREINLLMASSNSLLMLTSYYERVHFKVNHTFDLPYNAQFGFNKEETTLRGIIAKAQSLINT
jgi:ABC-type amino acid transport substrate-binding protein